MEYLVKTASTFLKVAGVTHKFEEDNVLFFNERGDMVLLVSLESLAFLVNLNTCSGFNLPPVESWVDLKY